MDIDNLVCQGVVVDDDNEPAPENNNLILAVDVAPLEGTWEKPTIYPCHANLPFAGNPGKWKNHPEVWIIEGLIPTMNKELVVKLSLKEFYHLQSLL